jgi:hypothetical protein
MRKGGRSRCDLRAVRTKTARPKRFGLAAIEHGLVDPQCHPPTSEIVEASISHKGWTE